MSAEFSQTTKGAFSIRLRKRYLVIFASAALAAYAISAYWASAAPRRSAEAHLRAVHSSDWASLMRLAPPLEISENELDESSIAAMFQHALGDQAGAVSRANTIIRDVRQATDRSSYCRDYDVQFSSLGERRFRMEVARDADGDWRVPVFPTLLYVCQARTKDLAQALDLLAGSFERAGISEFYVWHRDKYVTTERLRAAAAGRLEPHLIETTK
jgi:hypothetical protein